jgi:hypothetical protein
MSNFHFDLSLKLSQGEVHDFSWEVQMLYHNIPREERISKLCQANELEIEEHFLISCDAYDNIRQDFLTVLTNNTYQREQHLSLDILKSTEKETILKLSKFVFSYFELRDKRLETMDAEH